MAAGWLAGGLGAAGWLAGRPWATQDPETHPLEDKSYVPGALTTTYLKAYKTGTRKLTSYKATRLQDYRDYKATRLQDYKTTGTTGDLLQRYASQPGGPKGPADMSRLLLRSLQTFLRIQMALKHPGGSRE